MPHLFSGLNQKRFGGNNKIEDVSINLGNTRGKASSTRMYNYCTQHSTTPSNCINEFISIETPNVDEGILFNISSFDKLFDYDKSGVPKPIPSTYKTALIFAANRWKNFIQFQKDTIALIRTANNFKNWNGIELIEFTIYSNTDVSANVIATAGPIFFNYTSLNPQFILNINQATIQQFDQKNINNIISHELGHALGMVNGLDVRVNANQSGAVLLPNINRLTLFKFKPDSTNIPIGLTYQNFPALNAAYDGYGGTCLWDQSKTDGTNIPIDGSYNPIDLTKNWSGHFSVNSIFSNELETVPPAPNYNTSKYVKRGLPNEIMTPTYNKNDKYFISNVTLGFFADLYTNFNGKKYYNYELLTNFSEVKKVSHIFHSYNLFFNSDIVPPLLNPYNISSNFQYLFDMMTENNEIDPNDTIYMNCGCDCGRIIT
jgi:hypothetical protein